MKFLLIVNNDFDGVGQPAVNLSSNLKKKGHKTKIITLHKKSENKDLVEQLNSLNELYKSGVLTKEEFEKAKKNVKMAIFCWEYQ